MCLADHALHGLAEAIGFASTCPQFSPTLRCAQPPFACPLTSPSKNSCASTHSLPATDKYQPRAPLPTNRTSLATQLLPNLQAAASTIASATRSPQPTQAASASFAKTPTPLRLPSAGLRRFATFGGHSHLPNQPHFGFSRCLLFNSPAAQPNCPPHDLPFCLTPAACACQNFCSRRRFFRFSFFLADLWPNDCVSGTACFPRRIVGDATPPQNRQRCPTA